ncbi:TonB-dependent receptor [Bacteroides sp. 51]|uniref:SusC/RagA family TonB-linked outer membrane protein n=1 Tax=Bacteroides sp. 51 TaxID=2302938 RepID=UPI0013D3151D|nr:TonB-dependent receptor [Bacteroides sp. 51]NDV81202.1 TonB-dependent receptor [Bacteroides sp. 51]
MRQYLLLLFLGVLSLTANAQVSVSGVVTDAMNEPLPGISIAVENSTTGTITDLDGKYNLTVPNSNSTLIFSFIGYKTQKITVGNRTVINVTLMEDIATLDEVVVVGYGTQKKVNVTGAVSSINFEDQALSRPVTSVSSSLAGLSAGLSVSQGSGQPGADGATLRVRGVGTLNDNNPLILIDGMIGSIDDVNPNDIASISILKDGASAAIYGARAGAGVILITTKTGNKGGKATVTYSGRLSIMNAVNLPETVNNYADFMEYTNEANWQSGGDGKTFDAITDIQLWRDKAKDPNGINEYGYPNYIAYPNTNWQDETYNKNSMKSEHNLSISGGSENTRYLMSIGYVDNPGLVDYSGMERFNMRANIEADVAKWLTVGTRIYGNKDRLGVLDFDGTGDNAISKWLMAAVPGVTPYYDGVYGGAESINENPSPINIRQRLDAYATGRKDRTRLNTTIYAKVKIMDGLTYDVNLNYDRLWQETNKWGSANNARKYSFSRGKEISPATANDQLSTSNNRYDIYSYTLEHLLNYSKTFAKDHDVTALLGYQEYYWKQWDNGASRRGLIDETIHNLSSGTEVLSATGTVKDRASRAIFGRLGYAFKSRYLFEFNMRYDGHSRFHKDQRWGTFPSVSAGWRVTEESFMENTRSWLDNLKLRVSWGKNGNYGGSSVGDYEYQGGYSAVTYPFGDSQHSGLVQKDIANQLLSWENTSTTNIGLEAAFLNNRLTFEFDAFWKKTDGILYRITIPLTAGDKTAPRMNLAELENKGYEFTIGWRDRVGKFNYGVSANLSYATNEVSKYKGTLEQGWVDGNWVSNLGDVSQGDRERVVEGKMMNEYFLRTVYKGTGTYTNTDGTVNPNGGPRDGMIRTEADMAWVKAMVAAGYTFQGQTKIGERDGLYYGDYIYADNNDDKVLGNDADRKFLESSSIPKYTYGFQLYGEWKGIDVSMNFAGAAGFKLLMYEKGYNSTLFEFGRGMSQKVVDNHYFYDPANPDDSRTNIHAKYGRITQSTVNNNHVWSDLYLYKGDYLKLKNLTIGYSLPKQWLSKISLEKVRFYYSGENLFSLDSFPGTDPEQGATPKYQPIRQHAFGVNVTF